MKVFRSNRHAWIGPTIGCVCLTGPAHARAGPDVVVGHVANLSQLGREGPIGSGTVGLGMNTTACNKGDEIGNWFGLPDTDHPVILLNLYRLKSVAGSDRFEQIGQSWLKHGFGSSNDNECGFGCLAASPSYLGVGCSDTYAAVQIEPCGLGERGPLAPRSVIHPFTGVMAEGADLGSGGGCTSNFPSANHIGHRHDGISHRLQVRDADLMPASNPDARYFAEGQYVAPHEFSHGNGNQNNNAAYREFTVSGPDETGWFTFSHATDTFSERPGIDAWPDSAKSVIEPMPLGDGRAYLAYKITDLGGGLWHYEYTVYNMNLDEALGSFSVPVPSSVAVSNTGFHAPLNHAPEPHADNYSNDPWEVSTVGGAVTWSTDSFTVDPLANAVRFGTSYNFRFDADGPPQSRNATVGLFKSGGTMNAATLAPRPAGPRDCNENGVDDVCDIDCDAPGCAVPGCGNSADCDETGVPDECEIDCNGNGIADICDVGPGGGSTDCTGNGVPDECESDCDEDGTADFCEIVAGTSNDCNHNGAPDGCEITTGAAPDDNGNGIPDECDELQAPSPGPSPVQKNRFLTLSPGNPGQPTALRVTLLDVPPPYGGLNGRHFWIGAPQDACENAGQSSPPADGCAPVPEPTSNTFKVAPLECEPNYMEWSGYCLEVCLDGDNATLSCVDDSDCPDGTCGVCVGGPYRGLACLDDGDCAETLHVYHSAVIPGGTYAVQAIAEAVDVTIEARYSPPLVVTNSKWGDLVDNCTTRPCGPPDGIVNVTTDVLAVLDKFRNVSGAPIKARCDLVGIPPNYGELDLVISILDVTAGLNAFVGGAYTFPPGDPCP
jgi:hypothetical protein